MTNLIIYLFILIANVVAILLIYHSFDRNIEKTYLAPPTGHTKESADLKKRQ